MKLDLDLDTTAWVKSVESFSSELQKDSVDVVNGSMASILFKGRHSVIRKTYRQTKAGIRASLRKRGDLLLINMARKWLRERGRPLDEHSVGLAAQQILLARWKSVRYIIAGWAPAARDFGANRIGRPSTGSVAAEGKGKRATATNREAVAINMVGTVIEDGRIYQDVSQTMQDAVNNEARALDSVLEKRAQRLAAKHSGK